MLCAPPVLIRIERHEREVRARDDLPVDANRDRSRIVDAHGDIRYARPELPCVGATAERPRGNVPVLG